MKKTAPETSSNHKSNIQITV